ncbi:MAG: ABC transporter substrate-binding protein, partial [Candidatus Auribacterota bacterium]|nr:ABC transporter substrate-binding protein [Candidatus Auribacterota bacterium]
LHLRLKDDPSTLDPAYIVDVPGGALAAKIYNGLVRFDPEGRVIPDLASRWEISDDGQLYCFHLREGIRFTNGREVTAEDVVYSLRRILEPETNSPRSWLLSAVKGSAPFLKGESKELPGIRTGKDGVVEIELDKPTGLFLDFLAMPNASIVPREEVERTTPSFSDHPCGTGPFKLTEWKHNNRIILAGNPDYFMGSPRLSGIEYRIIPEALTTVVEFEQGNLDIMEVPRAEYKKYTGELPWKEQILNRVGLNSYYLGFNCEKAPWDNYLVRQAVNYAIDRRKIIDVLLQGRAVPAFGPVPPGLLPPVSGKGYQYNPDKARSLLEAAGVKLPLKIVFLFKADREVLSISEVIQDYLKKVGIEAVLIQREWSSFKEAVNKGDFDIFFLSWWGDYPDAENFLYPTFYSGNIGPGGNRSRFSDREIDEKLRTAARETNREDRLRILSSVEARVIRLAPWVFLWHKKEVMVCQPRVENYHIPLIYNGDKFDRINLIFPSEK